MKKDTLYIIIIVVLVVVLIGTFIGFDSKSGGSAVSGGNQITETVPSTQTNSVSPVVKSTSKAVGGVSVIGSTFVPPSTVINLPVHFDTASTTETILVASPSQGTGIASPLQVDGNARGQWFSNGSFQVVLTDSHNKILAEGNVTSQSDWQTNDFVVFSGTLYFSRQQGDSAGFIYFLKGTPSGTTSGGEAAVMPVVFE